MTRAHLDCMPKVAMDRAFPSGPILEEYFYWNVLRDANIDHPIQTQHFLVGGATILIFMLGGFESSLRQPTVYKASKCHVICVIM